MAPRGIGVEIGWRLRRLDLKLKIDILLQLRKTRHEPTARKYRCRGDVPIEPILSGKTLATLSARGEFSFDPGDMRAHMNTLDPAGKRRKSRSNQSFL